MLDLVIKINFSFVIKISVLKTNHCFSSSIVLTTQNEVDGIKLQWILLLE